jgi:hypothetical protein
VSQLGGGHFNGPPRGSERSRCEGGSHGGRAFSETRNPAAKAAETDAKVRRARVRPGGRVPEWGDVKSALGRRPEGKFARQRKTSSRSTQGQTDHLPSNGNSDYDGSARAGCRAPA